MRKRYSILKYLLGFIALFGSLFGVFYVFASINLANTPYWLSGTLGTLGFLALIGLLATLFLSKSAKLTRDTQHDHSRPEFKKFAEPGPQDARTHMK
ncbi:MAG: hypothetical protein CMM94_03835 [Rickettsiales bacterium]|nr:hypothetical protein [Rickettsiales bacterium]|tara:strand:+ start:170 stop:460 length:291 start_codon:yes stop_codon:yes gene_type:complete